MKRILVLVVSVYLVVIPSFAQKSLLKSGPMVGYSTMKEVLLWVQTTDEANIRFEYWPLPNPQERYSTKSYTTNEKDVFVAKVIADSLEPGNIYNYTLFINDLEVGFPYPLKFQSQGLWQQQQSSPDFTFALGSCADIHDERYDKPENEDTSHYGIFQSIHEQNPDFMLWLGDNLYLREQDWNSRMGIMYRYSYARALDELQPLLATTHHYAIWDDHDYGPNDSDRSYWNNDITYEAFKLFWGNPNYNLTGKGGITGTFTWNDAQFFLLDNRWFRTPNHRQQGERAIIGKDQLQWLIDALVHSKATFKFIVIGGQVLNPAAVYENYANYPEERDALIDAIRASGVSGVMFLTGDRHHSELTILKNDSSYPLYDLTVSPLTSNTHAPKLDENPLRVPGTLINDRNFGLIKIRGPVEDRKLLITIHDTGGKILWETEISKKNIEK